VTIDIDTAHHAGPAVADLVDVEVEEITVDAQETEVPSASRLDGVVGDDEESAALRQARKHAQLSTSTDSVRAYLK
jgi:RNA polymerase primary sigma factor